MIKINYRFDYNHRISRYFISSFLKSCFHFLSSGCMVFLNRIPNNPDFKFNFNIRQTVHDDDR